MSWATPYIKKYETQYRLPPGLLGSLLRAESGVSKDARSPAGAFGPAQLMPATAAALGVDINDPEQNIKGGAMYLAQQLRTFGGNVDKALAAYNAGPGAVQKYGGVPPYQETRDYVKRIHGFWKESGRQGQAPSAAGTATGSRPSPPRVVGQVDVDPARVAKLQNAWSDAPANGGLRVDREYAKVAKQNEAIQSVNQKNQSTYAAQLAASQGSSNIPTVGASGWIKTPGGWVQAQRAGEQGWKFGQRLGTGFGLGNDAGNSQTTGGVHQSDGWHPKGAAIDYGDAKNDWTKLNTWYDFLNKNKQRLGVVELLNEGDHIHSAFGGMK